jgi:hypothetical protein
VAYRVDGIAAAEGVVEAAQAFGEFEQRLAGSAEAGLVVVGQAERRTGPGPHRELVLQRVHRSHIAGVSGVHQDPHRDEHVRGVELGHG